jgi:hypothetical protein
MKLRPIQNGFEGAPGEFAIDPAKPFNADGRLRLPMQGAEVRRPKMVEAHSDDMPWRLLIVGVA